MIIALFVFLMIALFVGGIVGVVSGIRQSRVASVSANSTVINKKFKHPTKANSNPIPLNPCYFNIGSTVYHQSKECSDFSLLETWDAITKSEALTRGFTACPLCRESIDFVYSRGRVYHRTKFCSDSQSIPYQISEKEAIAKGLHRCGKCW